MSTMKLPANYASISEEEMVYLDGGARDAYNSFLNVGKVFNAIARIFSGASSIINNVNVIYQSFLTLGDLLKSKKWLPDAVMQYALRIFYAIK